MTRQVFLLLLDDNCCSRLFQLNSNIEKIASISIVSQRRKEKYQFVRDWKMSKHKLHDDDIYVAPYTRRTGKYRHVCGHYRRRSYRKSTPYSPPSYQHEQQGKSDIITEIVLAILLVILVIVTNPVWLYVLFSFLIYLLIAVVLGCVVIWAVSRLWENKFKYGKD